ncbi:hypothetical protein FAZ69_20665 [Trinickia terrae]|uniref:2OG-Fe dioxygenase family protein n=1 Tax=Trinickia terrae TaxID=2571161 RepID=A0A4V5PJD7_9BURK|nr:2OG-Fe dioxygenase family protein [Trinickia terrae]TKC86270.1 hypothetical protein FAZ69_20665 [Trinickia terrae]
MGAPYFMHSRSFYRNSPDVDLAFLQASFDNVPYDHYFTQGQRFRTTSRVEITGHGFRLLPKRPLYQPPSVNKLEKYGGICRDYEDAPVSLIESAPFQKLIMEWISRTGVQAKSFSVHQIRTTGTGSPVPEGRHHDGTDWTGLYVVKRHGIDPESACTTYWDREEEVVMRDILGEGELITFEDSKYTHDTTALVPVRDGAYRDVFVLTLPEHGVNVPDELIGE